MSEWPKKPLTWIEERTLYVSVPFTWNLPAVRRRLAEGSLFWDRAVVGGPAVQLMPDYLAHMDHVTLGSATPGVLQRVNPLATRTTLGCVRSCRFCAIGTGAVEPGGLTELPDWPDLPVLCDNNLLAASWDHFEKVVARLVRWGWGDFNQGLDARLMTRRHAELLAEIRRPMVRLALDSPTDMEACEHAFGLLRGAGIAKRNIRSYCLIGFRDTPSEAWRRCLWVEQHGVKPLPMWFHRLDQLEHNVILPEQEALGWHHTQRRQIMGWFYKHRGTPGPVVLPMGTPATSGACEADMEVMA
ncbi:MAG: hypothetical protein GX591_01150 [Planctomycetes bacterium]|nr:hypothetical protein [Planctomycetota bacterium]